MNNAIIKAVDVKELTAQHQGKDMQRDSSYWELKCAEKAQLVSEMLGQKPFEAIGVREEIYIRWSPATRYTKFCKIIKGCKNLGVKHIQYQQQELIWFQKFLEVATTKEKDSLLGLINDTIAKAEDRKKIEEEIEQKKKELEELEYKYNML